VWAARSKKVPVVMTLHNYRLLCPGALFLRDGRICVKCRHKTVPYWGVFHRCFKNSLFASLALTLTIGIHKLLGTWRKGIETFITLTPFASDLFENSSLKLRKKQISIKPNWTFVTSIPTVKRGASFLFVGRLSEEKGIPFLLQTFKENGLTLQIVGDGPLREKVKTIKSQNIIWLGSRSREQVLKFMSQSKAIVFSSCCYEMFPLVIIEAFATGTPVIAPSLGSIPNIIEHKKTGLLYAPNDSRDFVKQLNLINSNPTLYDCLLTLTRQEYFSKYCPERAFSNLITIYRDLVPTLA
jgi:glycosyltransferase involved in cell wall biosynthesis